MGIEQYKEFLSETKATKKLLTEKRDKLSSEIVELDSTIEDLKEAREVVSAAGILAQDNTKNLFEFLVTQALQSVFGEEYSFELDSRYFRGQPEMEMFVVENGVKYSPKHEKGGAIIDILSFSSRIVSLAIRDPMPEPVLLLDEPFRCIWKDMLPCIGQLMQDISDQLDLQILCITHEKELAEAANRPEKDRSFLVTKSNGISMVERIA